MNRNSRKSDDMGAGLNRRAFVKLLPTGALASRIDLPLRETQDQQPKISQNVTKETLHAAEALIGIELTDALPE
jgi:hypothetical protein